MPRMTICRSSLSLLCALGLAAPALAQAPKTHTVKKGDTLWDISRTYLGDPFLWPQIYRMNTDVVEDPHWIYPGEVLRLDAAPGEPAVPRTDTPPPEPGIVVVSPGDTLGDGLDLFRRRRVTNVQEAFKLYRDVKYHPLRAGEFYSAGFLSEGDSLPYGRLLGPVTPEQIESGRTRAAVQLHTLVGLLPPEGGSYAVGDSVVTVQRRDGPVGYGQIVVPTGLIRITMQNGDAIEVGSRVIYLTARGPAGLDSDVILEPPGPGNNRAFGHCTLIAPVRLCTFSGGTGKFHFQVTAAVSLPLGGPGGPNFSWTGTYSFSPQD